MISSLTHLETLGVPGSSFLLSSPVRPLLTDAIEPKIEKTAAPQTKENGAKKSTLRLPSTTKYVRGPYLKKASSYYKPATKLRTEQSHAHRLAESAGPDVYDPASDRHSRFSHWHAGCSTKSQCTICEFRLSGQAQSVQP